MKKILSLLLLIVTVSCSKNEDKLPVAKASVVLDGVDYEVSDQISANENCNTLFINLQASNSFPYVLDLTVSKKGDVLTAKVAGHNENFETLKFSPTQTFKITSFEYNPENTSLKMLFEGTLFGSNRTVSKIIKGEINTTDVKPTYCNSVLSRFEAELESGSGTKERLYSDLGSGEFDSKLYRQYYYSNNGFRIVFESKTNFNTLKAGEYSIGGNIESPIKVTFQEYIGGTDNRISTTYIQNEWRDFQIAGTVEIGQTVTINETKGIAGKLNITALDGNKKVIYEVKNGQFTMASMTK